MKKRVLILSLILLLSGFSAVPFAEAGSATSGCGGACPADCATHGVSCTSTACSIANSGTYNTCCYDPPCTTPCWWIGTRRVCGAPCMQCANTACAATPIACSSTSRTNHVGTTACTYYTDSTIQSCSWPDCACSGTSCNPSNNGQKCDGCNYYSVASTTETCNNVDDDCDGSVDEGLTRGCGNCGSQTCSAGTWGTCTGSGVCAVSTTQSCGNCGTQTCSASCAWGSCTGEGVCAVSTTQSQSCYTGTVGTSGIGVCRNGTQTRTCSASCAWGSWGTCTGEIIPSAENTAALCSDGLDNDCDGLADAQEVITCDFTTPNITSIAHFPSEPIIQENINLSTTVVEENIFNVTVYADNSEVAECLSQRECSGRVSYGNIGTHNYFSQATDLAGHYQVSTPLRNFSVGGDATKTCLENTGNFGSVCDENYYCGSGGAFVNSQDGGSGDNQFSQQPGEASCCTTGDCTSSYIMPKCEGPPVFGVEYNPEIAACNGFDVIAEVEEPESLKCCAGTLTGKAGNIQEFDSYWSRQNSGYFKLAEAAEGDHLFCVAINQSGLNTVNFTIQKGDTKTNQIITAVGGVAKMPVTAEETGTYTCTAEMNGAVKTTELKVTEAGKDPTKLPVFNILQLIIALAIIGIYYGKKN